MKHGIADHPVRLYRLTIDSSIPKHIRESRRIAARFTVTEVHVGSEMRHGVSRYPGRPDPPELVGERAERFSDSVGIGQYRIDLHISTGGDTYIDVASLPFQIPLGALLPRPVRNLIAAGKDIGTTHISNGCFASIPWSGTSASRRAYRRSARVAADACGVRVTTVGYSVSRLSEEP